MHVILSLPVVLLRNIAATNSFHTDHFHTLIRGGGWNKKEATSRGRPQGKSTQLWLQSIAPASFFFPDSPLLTYDHSSYSLQGIHCDICMEILEQPIQLECDHLVCLHYCCTWLEVSHAKSCPCCSCSDLQPNHTTSSSHQCSW